MTSENPDTLTVTGSGERDSLTEIKCSWNVGNDKCIGNAITLSDECKSTLDETVSLDTCILLACADENAVTPCSVELRLPPKLVDDGVQIEQLTIVSEARVIEVYGYCGEYLTTVHAGFIDDFAGMVVYLADIQLKKPLTECSLRFARLPSANEMWLYGIRITAKKQKDKCAKSKFDMENIGEILKNQKLNDKTEMFKKFVSTYGSFGEKRGEKFPDPQTLLRMIGADLRQNTPLGTSTKMVSQRLSDLVPRGFLNSNSKTNGDQNPDSLSQGSNGDKTTISEFQVLETKLTAHIDKRLLEIEQRISSNIEKRIADCEQRQLEKLDLIINFLKEK